MKQQDFVNALRDKNQVQHADQILRAAQRTSRTSTDLARELAEWVSSLDKEEIRRLRWMLENVADSALYGFFCVLDGVRPIDAAENRGRLELFHVAQGGQRTRLNCPRQPYLHEVYREMYPFVVPRKRVKTAA